MYDAQFCRDLDRSMRVEWLETNGIGGYASGTVSGIPTRRYHALLVAPLRPPTERIVALFSLNEGLLSADGSLSEFSAAAYADTIHPRGFEFLERFEPEPFPTWAYRLPNGSLVEKRLALVHGENTVLVEYRLLEGSGGELRIRPRLVWRDYHALLRTDPRLERPVEVETGRLHYRPTTDYPPLVMLHDARRVVPEAYWFYTNILAVEHERGLDYIEDQWSPCELRYELTAQRPTAAFIATLDRRRADGNIADLPALLEAESTRRAARRRELVLSEDVPKRTATALEEWAVRSWDYLVRRGDDRWTILAGYPWFTDWGRDTMISLPGLTLALGRTEIARRILATYAAYCSEGMIPNRFPDHGETPEYNNVDGTLWFVEAIRRYHDAVPEDPIVRDEWYPLLRDILQKHRDGTRYGIHVDGDGLLHAGEPGTQLTWMDAKIGDWVVTPRIGKPVEVNALWYNALRTVEALAIRFGDGPTEALCADDAARTLTAFRARFVNRRGRGLFDVVDGPEGDDPTIRPNQIFAVSLFHRMLDRHMERAVVELVDYYLYTPFGLRSLAPNHPNYRPIYAGGPRERDAAYHQGPVWGWLWGPFMTAYGNAFGRDERYRQRLLDGLHLLATHRDVRGIGGLAEIYDGRPSHAAKGCPWQAWSMAEVLRVAAEEGLIAPTKQDRAKTPSSPQ